MLKMIVHGWVLYTTNAVEVIPWVLPDIIHADLATRRACEPVVTVADRMARLSDVHRKLASHEP